jgi:hypothetical protein
MPQTAFARAAASLAAIVVLASCAGSEDSPKSTAASPGNTIVYRFQSGRTSLAITARASRREGVCYWVGLVSASPLSELPACGPPVVGESGVMSRMAPREATAAEIISKVGTSLIFGTTARDVRSILVTMSNGTHVTVVTAAPSVPFSQPVRFYGMSIHEGLWPDAITARDRAGRTVEHRSLRPPPPN